MTEFLLRLTVGPNTITCGLEMDGVRADFVEILETSILEILEGDLEQLHSSSTTSESELQKLGMVLASVLFPGRIGLLVKKAVMSRMACIRVHLGEGLERYPWTLAFVEEIGFVALNPSIRFVYDYGHVTDPRTLASGLRMLLVVSNPSSEEYGYLSYAQQEYLSIRAALESAECRRVTVHSLEHASPLSLQRKLESQNYEFFHFIGHGDKRPTGGVIVLEGSRSGEHELLHGDELLPALIRAGTSLAVLSCCTTIGDGSSVGVQLARGGLPFVVAMQFPIADTSAHLFSRAFYASLSDGFSVSDSFFQAVSAIRGADRDWASPCLITSLPHSTLLRDPGQPDNTRGNLPPTLNSFVGRADLLSEVVEIIRNGNRLVTLLGSGGIGKTRFSIEVARALARGMRHGTWQIQLDAITDSDFVVEAVARTFGIRETEGESLEDRLLAFLASQHILLVLDNCEHVLGGCHDFARSVLNRCPQVTILATSREVLATGSEIVVRVHPLSYPDLPVDEPFSISVSEALLKYEAVQLLVQRGATASYGFTASTETIEPLCRIAKRVDGIPLAIELAASRLRSFSPQQILDHLINDLGWLDLENPGTVPRHKTLRATLDSSYKLLSELERILFNRLAIFAANFSLDDARDIGGAEPLSASQVPAVLSRLVDKSLVSAVPVHGEMRYQLLDTCRRYASEQLGKDQEYAETGLRLLGAASVTSARFFKEVIRGDNTPWKITSDDDLANGLAAIDWSVNAGVELGKAAQIANDYVMYRFAKGDLGGAKRTAMRILKSLPEKELGLKCQMETLVGFASIYAGDPSGLSAIQSAYTWAKSEEPGLLFPNEGSFCILPFLVDCAYMVGNFEQAVEAAELLLEWAQAKGIEARFESMTLGKIEMERGNFDVARTLFEGLLQALKRKGDSKGEGMVLCHLGYLDYVTGNSNYGRRFADGIRLLASDSNHYFFAGFLYLASVALLPDRVESAAVLQGFAGRLREGADSKADRVVEKWCAEVTESTRAITGSQYDLLAGEGRTLSLALALKLFQPDAQTLT